MAVLNLAVSRWTIFADVFPTVAQGASPVALTGGEFAASADALAGNDRVTGTGNGLLGQGIGSRLDNGRFYMSLGDDAFAGTGAEGVNGTSAVPDGDVGADGVLLTRGSLLNTGVSLGLLGLLSLVPLDDDSVVGNGGAGGEGFKYDDQISDPGLGGGDGGAGGVGIKVECSSMILTGDGRDSITGTGGAGGDGADGSAGSTTGIGGFGGNGGAGIYVSKSSSISMGEGRDTITGIGGAGGAAGSGSTPGDAGVQGAGIHNKGTIDMGSGNDTINALQGGFAGCGTYNLGSGNDQVKGFGSGTFQGQSGWDSLVLPGTANDYTITLIGGNNADFTVQNINGDKQTMTCYGFESIAFMTV